MIEKKRIYRKMGKWGFAGLAALASLFAVGALAIWYSHSKTSVTLSMAADRTSFKPPIFGIGIHFGIGGERNYRIREALDAMQSIGLRSFRDDIPWSIVDPHGLGEWSGEPRGVFELLEKQAWQRPILILGHANPANPAFSPPLKDAARESYGRFVQQAVQKTKAHNPIYEIWNEWNMGGFGFPTLPRLVGEGRADDPRAAHHYTALARVGVSAVKAAAGPDAAVLVGAVGDDPDWQWTQATLRAGILEGADGLSVHAYNHCQRSNLRTSEEMVRRLTKLHQMMGVAPHGGNKKIFVTEVGWPVWSGKCTVNAQQASDNVSQFLFWSATTPWIGGIWLYELKDSGTNDAEIEHRFGMFGYNYEPKPAVCAVRESVDLIDQFKAAEYLTPTANVRLINAQLKDGRMALVAWTTSEIAANINISAKPLKIKKLCDESPNTSSPITLTTRPVIFLFDSQKTIDIQIASDRVIFRQ